MGSLGPQEILSRVHPTLIEKLKSQLAKSTVLTPDNGDEYAESIVRWSDTFEKKAVSVPENL
jgi:hypothetical protein